MDQEAKKKIERNNIILNEISDLWETKNLGSICTP